MKILYKKQILKKWAFNNGFYGQDIVMAFSPPEYCRLFAQKKAYQGGVTGTSGPLLAMPLVCDFRDMGCLQFPNFSGKSGWKVNGTQLLRSFYRKISGSNGEKVLRVVIFFQRACFKGN